MSFPWHARTMIKEVNRGVFGNGKRSLGGVLKAGSSQNPLMDIVLGLITNPQSSGLQGLIQTFKGKGLGDAMSSWISMGENQPVSGDQIQHALGVTLFSRLLSS
jgi:uncharacterized protein YidB (DUF937 family)